MTESPRTLRPFLRDYIDDLVRLVTLAAIFGGTVSTANAHGGWWFALPALIGILALAVFLWMTFAFVEFFAEHYPRPSVALFLAVLACNSIMCLGAMYLVGAVVIRALHGIAQ